jgi:hypothetical protein
MAVGGTQFIALKVPALSSGTKSQNHIWNMKQCESRPAFLSAAVRYPKKHSFFFLIEGSQSFSELSKIFENFSKLLKSLEKLWKILKVLKCGAGEGWRRSVGPIM